MNKQHRRPAARAGFTLIEVLVTIVIISILIALLLPAVNGARRTAQITQVRTEITQLAKAINDFKVVYGVEPPSSITLYETGTDWDGDDDSRSKIRRIWPQFNFALDRQINVSDTDTTDTFTLTGAECLAFFLGGMFNANNAPLGFSNNPADPFASGGTRQGPFHEFDINRFVDIDTDTVPEYAGPVNGMSAPYWYISSNDGRGYQATSDLNGSGMTSVYTTDGTEPWKAQSFQIVSPGFDNLYGPGGEFDEATADNDLKGTRIDERDNITNFHNSLLAP